MRPRKSTIAGVPVAACSSLAGRRLPLRVLELFDAIVQPHALFDHFEHAVRRRRITLELLIELEMRPRTMMQTPQIARGVADDRRIREESWKILRGEGKAGRVPDLWDGKASERIVDAVTAFLRRRAKA